MKFGNVKIVCLFLKDYGMYLAVMTTKERVLYHKIYNVARGLCLREKQERTLRDVRHTTRGIEESVARYMNHVQGIKVMDIMYHRHQHRFISLCNLYIFTRRRTLLQPPKVT